MRKAITRLGALSLMMALLPLAVQADPITYSFSTGILVVGDNPPPLLDFFSGLSVSGTFDYDPATPASGTVGPGSSTTGSTLYSGSNTNLFGSVGANSFSDSVGGGLVGDDKFIPAIPSPPPAADILALRFANVDSGFDMAGFRLLNVRLFWIEGQLGITDFLSDQNLPGVLPTFAGRLALDFAPIGDPDPQNNRSIVFFNGLTVTQVPEPGTLALFGIGLFGLVFARRRKA